jgi:hypothetical protein
VASGSLTSIPDNLTRKPNNVIPIQVNCKNPRYTHFAFFISFSDSAAKYLCIICGCPKPKPIDAVLHPRKKEIIVTMLESLKGI